MCLTFDWSRLCLLYQPKKISHTIFGVPHYDYSILGPKNPILFIKAPILNILVVALIGPLRRELFKGTLF